MNQSKRIYYLSTRPYVKDYMEKIKFKRTFLMKSYTQKKFLPKRTRQAIDELVKMSCEIKYVIR